MHPRRYAKPISIYVDQDGPLADFALAAAAAGLEPQHAKMTAGFYRGLPVTPGAREALEELHTWADIQVFVVTKIPDHNPLSATEKIQWLHEHFPLLEERIIITPNKACIGTAQDYLIDDRAHKADAYYFPGTFLHFQTEMFPGWPEVMAELRRRLGR